MAARFCVELDKSAPRPNQIWIGWNNYEGFVQEVEYEIPGLYCNYCHRGGHELQQCLKRIKKPAHVPVVNTNSRMESSPIEIPPSIRKTKNKDNEVLDIDVS